jgi:hypothetical protein
MSENMAKTAKKAKKKAPHKPSAIFHGKANDGRDVVGIGNLRVIIVQDDDVWFAQGLEIDYAAQGSSVSNVKKKFERGLCATIHENLKAYGNIEKMLRAAPPDVWQEMLYTSTRKVKEYSQVSFHDLSQQLEIDYPDVDLPFEGINFVERETTAA